MNEHELKKAICELQAENIKLVKQLNLVTGELDFASDLIRTLAKKVESLDRHIKNRAAASIFVNGYVLDKAETDEHEFHMAVGRPGAPVTAVNRRVTRLVLEQMKSEGTEPLSAELQDAAQGLALAFLMEQNETR